MNKSIIIISALLLSSPSWAVGNAEDGEQISTACAGCHGKQGLSADENFPNLAGQKASYIIKQLQAYQSGQRINTTMQAEVGPLNAKNIEDLAAYYASQSTVATYSLDTRIVSLPRVQIGSDYYRTELLFDGDSTFTFHTPPEKN